MVEGKPADYVPVIKANWKQSHAYLVSIDGSCIDGWQQFATRGRKFVQPLGGLPKLAPEPRSVVGIVVCPGDDIKTVVDWLILHKIAPPERVMIVYHPGCDMVKILEPWYAAFEVDPLALELTKWPGDRIATRFGQWYNDWIYLDATGKSWPL